MALALLAPEAPAHPYGDVAAVAPGSAAARAGLAPGDRLLAVNGHSLRDVIDFRFYTADDELTLEVQRAGVVRTVRLVHGPEDPLGLELRGNGLELIAECNNHCPFCFVTQLPKGMRRTLSIKDDDYRYSFLFANFVTLTNLSEQDWARIEEQHLSPLYVSVHSTDAQMRRKLLGNRFAEDPLEQIDRLGRSGITVHTQLVVCPGVNDGDHLERSIADLVQRYPQVQTVAVVPVGLTRIRTERTMSRGMPLRKFRPEEAQRVLQQVSAVQKRTMAQHGEPIVYAADELYLLAGQPVPPAAHYTDWAQLENGVGLVRQLLDDWQQLKRAYGRPPLLGRNPMPAAGAPPWGDPVPAGNTASAGDRTAAGSRPRRWVSPTRPRRLTMACGTLIAPVLQQIVGEMNALGDVRVDLHVVPNRLFGDEVTCSGLLVGRDLLAALEGRELGDIVALPRALFDHTGTLTLDDLTLDDLQDALGRPIVTARRITDLEWLVASG